MRPTVVVVSHTHWDREWYQPFEVFRLRLGEMVDALLTLLEREPQFRHFMLDGQTICLDDLLELHPGLRPRLVVAIEAGRLGIGPWYVLQDEFLVGAESIVRNLAEGLRGARRFGRPMAIGYLPDAFGHIAQMPRILRGFGIDTAVVWRGVGDGAPGSEWRWRAPSGAEVLCLFLPGGYGNAHRLGAEVEPALQRLDGDLARTLPSSRAALLLWMNGNDHQPAEPELPALLEALRQARPDVDIEHASLERAAALVRARIDPAELPVVAGELRHATAAAPLLSGVWSARSWQKRHHDRAQALLVRFAEPFTAFAGLKRRDALAQAWRLLLQCQPHDSICGCSVDAVHREITGRLERVQELGHALLSEAVQALAGAPTPDFGLHEAVAVVSPHSFSASAWVEVELHRRREQTTFRLRGPAGEVPYEVISRRPSDGPDGRPSEWLRLRLFARDLPPHGLHLLALEPGTPSVLSAAPSTLVVAPIEGGVEITDPQSGLRILHTFVDEGDRGDLYDFCPKEGEPPRAVREGLRVRARALGSRVEIEVDLDHRTPDHRLRAHFALSAPPAAMWTETAFGWVERTTAGTHPVSAITLLAGSPDVALGGQGLHEVERTADGAILLTLLRAVGRMSRGDLSTRPGHAGYCVETPEAQGLGPQRYRYAIAVGAEAVRELEVALISPHAVALCRGEPSARPLLSLEPASARLSICKRADEGEGLIVRLVGPPEEAVTARLRLFFPVRQAWWSDLDERRGAALELGNHGELAVPIAAQEVVTLRLE